MNRERNEPDISSWRNRGQLLRLIGEVCAHCNEKIFPPRDICPYCKQPTTTRKNLPAAKLLDILPTT